MGSVPYGRSYSNIRINRSLWEIKHPRVPLNTVNELIKSLIALHRGYQECIMTHLRLNVGVGFNGVCIQILQCGVFFLLQSMSKP